MSTKSPTPDSLLDDVVTELNIYIQWAEHNNQATKIAEHGEQICRLYRAMAICLLVSDGTVDEFFHWLLHAPLTHNDYLVRLKHEGIEQSSHSRASFVDPVLDAIAARQWKLAAEICALMAPEWIDGAEYEDDYCYGEFLRRIVRAENDDLEPLLARWKTALEGGRDPRLDVVEALISGDAVEFGTTLREMLTVREAQASIMANPRTRSALASELPFFPNRWVSLEGLALLAIAERRGMSVAEEIEACPRMIRAGVYAPFQVRGYPNRGLP